MSRLTYITSYKGGSFIAGGPKFPLVFYLEVVTLDGGQFFPFLNLVASFVIIDQGHFITVIARVHFALRECVTSVVWLSSIAAEITVNVRARSKSCFHGLSRSHVSK